MEQAVAVFEPIRSGNYNLVFIYLLIALIALGGLVYTLKKKVTYRKKMYHQLYSLLAFFVLIIAGVTAFFNFWAAQKFTAVTVFPEAIETPFGTAQFENIQNVYIHNDQQLSRISGEPDGLITRILIIEEFDRKTHVLSEENYDIDSLYKVMERLEK